MTAMMRDAVSPDLRKTLRALKLGQMPATLPGRLTHRPHGQRRRACL